MVVLLEIRDGCLIQLFILFQALHVRLAGKFLTGRENAFFLHHAGNRLFLFLHCHKHLRVCAAVEYGVLAKYHVFVGHVLNSSLRYLNFYEHPATRQPLLINNCEKGAAVDVRND